MSAGSNWPMVGRDEELDLLHELVVQRRRSVVLAGPAGVGKSRLATEFLDALETAGVRTEWVRATRATKTIPFGAFARWLPDGPQLPPSRLHLLQTAARTMAPGDRDLAVGVDDVHLLDEGSVALLLHLLEHPSVTAVVTVRTDEPVSQDVTALWKDELVERIELDALPEAEVVALLERSLDGPVADDTVKQLWRLTAGRPLYLREVVRAAQDRGVLQLRAGEWTWRGAFPGTDRLTDLLRVRLAALAPAQREVVELVALGEPLPLEFLTDFDPAAVSGAERAGLLTPDARPEGTWVRIAHPLYGEVLRATLRPFEARHHLQTLAATAARLGWSESEPLRTATWMLDGGAPIDDARLFEVAATRALAVRDVRRTERLARVALDHGGSSGAALTLAAALVALERWDEADAVLDRLVEQPGDELTLVHAARARSLVLFHGRGDPHQAQQLLATTASRVSGPLRAWLHVQGSTLATFGGDPVTGLRLGHAALEEADLPAVRVHAQWAVALAAVQQGRTAAGVAAAEACVPFVAQAFEDDPAAGVLGPVYALALALDGRFDDAASYAKGVLDQAQRRHVSAYWATPQAVAAYVALSQGRLVDAMRLADAALVTFRQDNSYGGGDWCAAILATALAQSGDADGAAEVLAWVDSHLFVPPVYRAEVERARAWVHAARGELSAAQREALAVADEAARSGSRSPELLALLDVARFGGAASVASRLSEVAGRIEGPFAEAIGAYGTALVAREGEALDAAAEQFDAMGAVLLAAEASAEAARAHAAAGRPGQRLGSLARAAVRRARCAGARTPALRDVDAHPGLASLTAREREVVELACRHTNREIADRLYVSVRTVHTHLQHAYAKLGVNDRADLAALLAATTPT